MEQQARHFTVCEHCQGLEWVDTSSDQGYHLLGITIPRAGCTACEAKGYHIYESTNKGFTHVQLQDKKNDVYLEKEL